MESDNQKDVAVDGSVNENKTREDEIKERLEKITPKPWRVGKCVDGIYANKLCLVRSDSGEVTGVRQLGRKNCKEIEENADFIANAPSDIEYLLGENQRLREALTPASKLANAVVMYDWIYMLMDDERRNQLYDALLAWKKARQDLQSNLSARNGGN